jgi:hypothetical protein
MFNNSDSAAILSRFTKAEPVTPPSTHNALVSPTLDAIVLKALENDVSHRYASAREMADAIEANLQIASTSAVGRWLQSIVHEDLDKHSALIADIESGSTVSARPPKDDAPSVRKILASLTGARVNRADAETQTFLPPLDSSGDPASQSLISMTRSPSLPELKMGRRKRLVGIATAAGSLLTLAATVALWPRARTEPALVAQGSFSAVAPTPAVLVAPSAVPTVQLSALDTQPVPPPEASAQAHSAALKAVSRPNTARPGGSCNPPYSVDSRGIRHMKLACLR